MADKGGFPGHDEGSNKPPNGGYNSTPGTFAPLQTDTSGLTVKTEEGTTGKPEGGR